jgi:putative acetyltransferase
LSAAAGPGFEVRPADRPGDIAAIRALLLAYLEETGLDLGFQGFHEELAGLPGEYAPPGGCLLCAQAGERIVGCVAFRPLDEGRCEMKRLYVLPGFRRSALGAALVAAILERARAAGYAFMCLDTAPGMERAQALYARFGFRDIERYNDNPIPGVRFMGVDLR